MCSSRGDLCEDWYYSLCDEDADCREGYQCGAPRDGCTSSSCECNPETGEAGPCLRDCIMDARLCEPCPPGGCVDPVPCAEAGECVNGAWCEPANRPDCWANDGPVCHIPGSDISIEYCGNPNPCAGIRCDRGFVCEAGECVPQGCQDDDDCADNEWCRPTADPDVRECTPYRLVGESCGGFVAPGNQTRCDPDLTCAARNPQIPDLPGICRVPCVDDRGCAAAEYCAEDGVCREDSSCLSNADCNLPGNDYIHIECVGQGVCNLEIAGGTCGWQCDRGDQPPIER